ncbi:MAG: aminotransferase class III-fold pyridoxal phosphate-dependent enzyme [Bdellovibrionota bacterium]
MKNQDLLKLLHGLRKGVGRALTIGLSDDVVLAFLSKDTKLAQAITGAVERKAELEKEFHDLFKLDEMDLKVQLQSGILNFYPESSISPYVPIYAKGPWIITAYGAVVYDTGGYGMLGLGHYPDEVFKAVATPQVMANVMTPSFSQRRIVSKLKESIGHTRSHCPYDQFVFMNSGSEAMSVATRIVDINAKTMTDPDGLHAGKKIMLLGLERAFHGRTDRPAQVSDSTLGKCQIMASFRDRKNLITVPVNDIKALEAAFMKVEQENIFIEACFMEPVLGEGSPGLALQPEFYRRARELTTKYNSILIIDSIQAALRAHGVLSIVDYPGFSDEKAPDMESFSKALNAAQFPLSVLAIRKEIAEIYKPGVYGNTMTANPRALDVACAVLDQMDKGLRSNIVDAGREFLHKLKDLKDEFPETITKVVGTGLLLSAEIDLKIPVASKGGLEELIRKAGVNVIHGGKNALRFTPHFAMNSQEIDLVISLVRKAIQEFKAPEVDVKLNEMHKPRSFVSVLKGLFSTLF